MANSDRRYVDENGNQFLPMNVEGQADSDAFWTPIKLVSLTAILCSIIILVMYLNSVEAKQTAYYIFIGFWAICSSYVLRYIVFEERFYYKMYKERKGNVVTTPAKFWNIATTKDTDDGTILTYSDGKIGIIVNLDRDTITGKEDNFKEIHYDAVSDFIKSLLSKGYSFISMDLMEPSGNDPRLAELDKVSLKCQNSNIKRLCDLQVGYIKTIAQNSLYESDYYLVYTQDINKIDDIIEDTLDSMLKLLDGAFIGYKILGRKELVELDKYFFGVKQFNAAEASMHIYKASYGQTNPFIISGIVWSGSERIQNLSEMDRSKLRNLTSCVINETAGYEKISIKKAMYVEEEKIKVGVDFSSLGKGSGNTNVTVPKNKKQGMFNGHNSSSQRGNVNITNSNQFDLNNFNFNNNNE